MQLHVDRDLPISLADQIRGQLTYAIMCGRLKSGELLPSVRELSESLAVSGMTVARVYRDLSAEGLVNARPGSGTYVADISHVESGRGLHAIQRNLRHVADMYVRQALSLGYAPEEVRGEFLDRLRHHEKYGARRRVALIGNFRVATGLYAREIEVILHDLSVSVAPLVLEDLERDVGQALESLRGVRLVMTLPTRLQQIRTLLEPYGHSVVAVAFRASSETRRRLSAIASDRRLGVVATYPEFLQSLSDEVASYCFPQQPLLGAVIDQEELVRRLLRQIDVLIYATGSDRVLDWRPDGVEAIEYLHSPEPDSVSRLRPLITDSIIIAGGGSQRSVHRPTA